MDLGAGDWYYMDNKEHHKITVGGEPTATLVVLTRGRKGRPTTIWKEHDSNSELRRNDDLERGFNTQAVLSGKDIADVKLRLQ